MTRFQFDWAPQDGPSPSYRLSLMRLRDIASRARAVIQESESADEHAELIAELETLCDFCADCAHAGGSATLPATWTADDE